MKFDSEIQEALEKQIDDLTYKANPSAFPSFNYKFKTIVCQNYKYFRNCNRGSKCHFAHGDKELRKEDGPLPG